MPRAGERDVDLAGPESGKKSPIGRASSARLAADFPGERIAARARPLVRAADAATGDRFLLARASAARRSAGAGARGKERRARRMDLAPGRQSQERIAGDIPHSARALSRSQIRAGSRLLLRLRSAGFP